MSDFQDDGDDISSSMDFLKVDLRVIETLAQNVDFYRKTVSGEYLFSLKDAIANGCRNIRQRLSEGVIPVSSRFRSEVMARVQKVEEDLTKLWPRQPLPNRKPLNFRRTNPIRP
jgi:hypothetical protein